MATGAWNPCKRHRKTLTLALISLKTENLSPCSYVVALLLSKYYTRITPRKLHVNYLFRTRMFVFGSTVIYLPPKLRKCSPHLYLSLWPKKATPTSINTNFYLSFSNLPPRIIFDCINPKIFFLFFFCFKLTSSCETKGSRCYATSSQVLKLPQHQRTIAPLCP